MNDGDRNDHDDAATEEHEQDHSFQLDVDDDVLQEALRAVDKPAADGGVSEEDLRALEAEVETKTQEAAEWKDKYLRSVADLDNFRRRALKDREEARQYGAENLLRDLLVILDNLDLAMEAKGDAEQIKQGVKMTHDQFKAVMKQHGVEIIEATGNPFDPKRHEAVAHIPSEEHPAGTVVQEHRRGYQFKERLLRPTMVSVSKGEEAAPPPAPESTNPEESE